MIAIHAPWGAGKCLVAAAVLLLIGNCLAIQQPSAHPSHSRFHPDKSTTFDLIKRGNVNVTFLDKSNLLGYDAAEFIQLGGYRVRTRMGMITDYNSAEFDDVDGILGFGWGGNFNRSAALLKTLSQKARPHWDIEQPEGYVPMPRAFAFTASKGGAELQLGGYDDQALDGPMNMFPMIGDTYSVNITSIKYGGVELLHFNDNVADTLAVAEAKGVQAPAYPGLFDSGTTCNLLPSTTAKGRFKIAPHTIFESVKMAKPGYKPLVYTIGGKEFTVPTSADDCVEGASEALILGDPWFRKFVIFHDLKGDGPYSIGVGARKASYTLTPPHHDKHGKLDTANGITLASGLQKLALSRCEESSLSKVGLKSASRVTYNIRIGVGTPTQWMTVIFDTGSFMLAVFAHSPPKGMVASGLLQVAQGVRSHLSGQPTGVSVALALVAAVCCALGVVSVVQRKSRAQSLSRESDAANTYPYQSL